MFKNISIGQITIILTLFLAILNISILFILYSTGDALAISVDLWIIVLVVSLLFTYVIVKFFLEFFVFRKIKIIYKMISDSKQSKPLRSGESIKDKNLVEVNDEVIEWAEKQESEMDYLVRLEQYRKNFVGNISHELKTPLFAIQGYLLTLIEGGLYDENINLKYLKKAVNNTDRLQHIVDDLEVINQFESGNIVLNIDSFDIHELTTEIIEDLSFQAEAKEIELELKEGARSKFKVSADREKVRQVLNNLVTNAIKYV